jgi:hypothetical protein
LLKVLQEEQTKTKKILEYPENKSGGGSSRQFKDPACRDGEGIGPPTGSSGCLEEKPPSGRQESSPPSTARAGQMPPPPAAQLSGTLFRPSGRRLYHRLKDVTQTPHVRKGEILDTLRRGKENRHTAFARNEDRGQ